MRILLVGNFTHPYEEENLHNLTLLNRLRQEGNECRVINIAESQSQDNSITNIKNYLDFVVKLIRYSLRCDVIHFLTKGYTRPGLMKLMTTAVLSKLLLRRMVITLHSEMFSIFGRLRSKMGGQQLLRLSFSIASRIICSDRHTREVALTYSKIKDKFDIIPSFIYTAKDIKENEHLSLQKLENKKRIIVFSNVGHPSLLYGVFNNLLKHLDSDIGIVVSLSEENSENLQNVIRESANSRADNIVFIEPADERLMSMAYAQADLVLRTLSCDGKTLFKDFAVCLKRPAHSGDYLYFPINLLIIKEGEVAELCTHIINNLMEKSEKLPEIAAPASTQGGEDFYSKIKEIYSEK